MRLRLLHIILFLIMHNVFAEQIKLFDNESTLTGKWSNLFIKFEPGIETDWIANGYIKGNIHIRLQIIDMQKSFCLAVGLNTGNHADHKYSTYCDPSWQNITSTGIYYGSGGILDFKVRHEGYNKMDWTKVDDIYFWPFKPNSFGPKGGGSFMEDKSAYPIKFKATIYLTTEGDNSGPFDTPASIKAPIQTTGFAPKMHRMGSEIHVRCRIAECGNVSLNLYDAQGNYIAARPLKFRENGTHILIFNANQLNSGAYCILLTKGNRNYSKRLLLIKQAGKFRSFFIRKALIKHAKNQDDEDDGEARSSLSRQSSQNDGAWSKRCQRL